MSKRLNHGSATRLSCEVLEDRTTPAVVEPGFTDAAWVASGLNQATGLAWAPDGSNRLYVTLKGGFSGQVATAPVRVITNGALQSQPFCTESVWTSSECGILGITFDRDYTTNGFVYIFITASNSNQQIIRYTDTLNDNGTPGNPADDFRQGISRTVIMTGLPTTGNNHDGGGLGIGFDNKIYWSIGDMGAGGPQGHDANLTLLSSKVGRANLNGSVPNDNPFNDGAGPNNDYIWARGFRNPFTLTFQESTGQLWVNDVGTLYEQIFKVNSGNHAGWNDWEGNQPAGFIQPEIIYRTNGSDNRAISAAAGSISRSGNIVTVNYNPVAANVAFLQPGNYIGISGVADSSFNGVFDILTVNSPTQFTYAQTGANASSSGGVVSTGAWGGAVTGGTFLNTTAVPAQYRGNFLFGDINSDDVIRATLDGSSNVQSIRQFDNGFAGIVDVAVGPDGAIYYVTAEGASVRRTAYSQSVQNLIVTPQHLAFPEGGRTGFSVRLAMAPVSDVTVNVARTAGDTDLSVFSGATLTFTPANWQTPQAVVLAAAADGDTTDDLATFSISSTGLSTPTLDYRAIDAGGQNIELNTTTLTFDEGGGATFGVRLANVPAGNVTVTVARTAGDTDVTVASGTTLTFTPSNYSMFQQVSIVAAEDADLVNDSATISVSELSATTRTVSITVIDNDPLAPNITSMADTTAVINAPYSYDVDATGNPIPTFALSVFPAGMTINPTTGMITWIPASIGMVNVTVTASNGVGAPATQSFTITTSPDQAPTASITTPADGATVSGATAEFYGDGFDDVNTTSAEFRIDGVLAYTDTTPGGHYHIGGSHNLFNTTLLPNGPHTLRMTVYDTIGQSGFAEVNVTVDNPPNVLAFRVNDTIDPSLPNMTQSRVASLRLMFNTPVNAAAGAFSVSGFDSANNPVSVPGGNLTVTGNGTNVLTITYGGNLGVDHTSLADGRWRLNIENTLITAVSGPMMPVDYESPQFKRLFGDFDGNSTVNAADFAELGNVFGSSSFTFDFDNNGTIDADDLAEFGNRFGMTL